MSNADDLNIVLFVMGAAGLLLGDQFFNGGRMLNRIMGRYNQDKLSIDGGRFEFMRGNRPDPIGQIIFMGERVITNERGSMHVRTLALISTLGQRMWSGSSSDLDIPPEALCAGQPCTIRLRKDNESILLAELSEFQQRLATTRAESGQYRLSQYDFIRQFSLVAGEVKHNIGASVIVPQNRGNNQYTFQQKPGQDGAGAPGGGED